MRQKIILKLQDTFSIMKQALIQENAKIESYYYKRLHQHIFTVSYNCSNTFHHTCVIVIKMKFEKFNSTLSIMFTKLNKPKFRPCLESRDRNVL